METSEVSKYADSAENSRIRAEIWGDFVGWDNRRRGENGFLVNQLKNHNTRKVLDVASGDGVDTIFLLQHGFDVVANEVDDAFRAKAIENAKREGLMISPSSLDWRELDHAYQPESFDAIICIGNSITCLFGRDNQLQALRQFYRILEPGGVLLIDERNYQRILDNQQAALVGTLHSSGRFLYTGTTKVKSRFVDVSYNQILIEYTHVETGNKAYYRGYPFRKGELMGLLKEAGFSKIQQFSDYAPGNNPEADFYQYVCVR